MKSLTLLTALFSCLICVGTADAGCNLRYGKSPVDQLRKLDKNHDGKLDRYEFSLMHKKRKH